LSFQKTNFFNDITLNEISIIPLIIGLSTLIVGIVFSVISLSLRDYWKLVDL